MSSLTYPASLAEYAVPAREYLRRHPELDVLCTGVIVFNTDKKMLLVQRAAEEKAFPDFWEIPGGKVDDGDETILEAAARELREEAGLEASRVVRRVTEFTFVDEPVGTAKKVWLKFVFEMEVQTMDTVVLDPVEHQHYVFASEEDVYRGAVGATPLVYISEQNKSVKLEAFRLQREGRVWSRATGADGPGQGEVTGKAAD